MLGGLREKFAEISGSKSRSCDHPGHRVVGKGGNMEPGMISLTRFP